MDEEIHIHMNQLKVIFLNNNNWKRFKKKHKKKIRPIIIKEIEKFLYCGDPMDLPRFRCEQCAGAMVPVYYQGLQGIIYDNRDLK